jgi:hypothetical protein
MRRLRGEEALRGLLVGMALVRIKHSMPHGTFGPWVQENITAFGDRWASYLMRLGLAFAEKAKVTKPELLAIPGDQTELALDTMEGAQRRFVEKAVKFVGELSLNELLIKYGIKAVGVKTELTKAEATEQKVDFYAEVAERVDGFRALVTSRESLMRLPPQQLDLLAQTVADTYSQFQKLYQEAKSQKGAISI